MDIQYYKLYSLIQASCYSERVDEICQKLACFQEYLDKLKEWWHKDGYLFKEIADSSDRINLQSSNAVLFENIKHPIGGQDKSINLSSLALPSIPQEIQEEIDINKIYWWFWRFLPELHQDNKDILLYPAHAILPDCPWHSYSSTVSALVGAMDGEKERPYILLFTFSPVQEFIKASRKFLDFWAGSYLLHYLSAILCWYIAEKYSPDAVITPSLWSQEIIDAFLLQKYPNFDLYFQNYTGNDPKSRFNEKESTSLSTAGFPNVITVLVPGADKARQLGEYLENFLRKTWLEIGNKVKQKIKTEVISALNTQEKQNQIWETVADDFLKSYTNEKQRQIEFNCKQELKKWSNEANWEWNKLWDVQLQKTWETYWTAIPLGHPDSPLKVENLDRKWVEQQQWLERQQEISQSRQEIPTKEEKEIYQTINVGTWWGSLQQRLGQTIKAVKNIRTWEIPPAPGERSTLSGQFSAVHPNLVYNSRFQEGGGLSSESMRLFWRVMEEVQAFRGLFNGSEKLNALEMTKRMAWVDGGVAGELGIKVEEEEIYEAMIRFPNLSSIAAARFAHDHSKKIKQYSNKLNDAIEHELSQYSNLFRKFTCNPFQIPKTDLKLNPDRKKGEDYNGVMFSSKWLADDLELQDEHQISILRNLVAQTHKECGFGNSSPADWWVIVLGDGDGMGDYVSGKKLKKYEKYVIEDAINKIGLSKKDLENLEKLLKDTTKRMGPATHVGLNRALLDFSNRLVPYLTEKRCCGKVIYSGGDDVMAVLPIEDLPLFLRSLRAAWSGEKDPEKEFTDEGGYWTPTDKVAPKDLSHRPYFTMGENATMSLGIVIAHKSVPLPTVLETLWEAEKERAKKLQGAEGLNSKKAIPPKDGLCFRVIYSSGNVLEAVMKGHLLENWCEIIEKCSKQDFSPLLYRLAEELPDRCPITENLDLFREAAKAIISRRDDSKQLSELQKEQLLQWLHEWEDWAFRANPAQKRDEPILGTQPEDLGNLLRFTAFWVDRLAERENWVKEGK